MKKFFTFVAAVLFAVSASADVIWSESLDKNGSYIDKDNFNGYWPYATQWYEAGNFVYEYDSVGSSYCSVRSKKLNGDAENSLGFYFAANKPADQCYLYLGGKEGAIVEGAVGCKLMFDICSTEADGGDLSTMVVAVNGTAFPAIDLALGSKLVTSPVEFALPDGNIQNIQISFDSVPSQKFIAHLRIEGEAGKAHGEGGIVPPVAGPDTITVAQAVAIAEALAEPAENGQSTTDTKEYVVKGFAVQVYPKNDDGTWSFFMADKAGAYGPFSASNTSTDADVVENDFMLVRGKIAKRKTNAGKIQLQIYKGTGVHGQAPQGIENIIMTEKTQKVIVDGVVYIVRDGKLFNLQGVQVR